MKWIETTLSCQYITALNQLEKQHGVSSMEMDFHLIRCLVLARGDRQVSQQSGLCASHPSWGHPSVEVVLLWLCAWVQRGGGQRANIRA